MDPIRCKIRLLGTFSEKVALQRIWHLRDLFFAAHDLVIEQFHVCPLYLDQRPLSQSFSGGGSNARDCTLTVAGCHYKSTARRHIRVFLLSLLRGR